MARIIVTLFSLLLVVNALSCVTPSRNKARAKTKKKRVQPYLQPFKSKVKIVKSKRAYYPNQTTGGKKISSLPSKVSVEDILFRIKQVERLFAQKRYFDVVIQYEAISTEIRFEAIPNYVTLLYGLSLIEKKDYERGTVVLSQLDFDNLELPEQSALLVKIGSVYDQLQNKEKAQNYYRMALLRTKDNLSLQSIAGEKLAQIEENQKGVNEALKERMEQAVNMAIEGRELGKAMQICRQIIENSDSEADRHWRERAEKLLNNIKARIEAQFEVKIAGVRKVYLDKKDFNRAKELLAQIELDYEDEKYQKRVQMVREDMEKVIAYNERQKASSETELGEEPAEENLDVSEEVQKIYQEAVLLSKNGQYKLAIKKLESIEGSEMAEKVRFTKGKIINLYVKGLRKKASELYFKGTSVKDRVVKIDFYVQAYRLLKSIIIEFPNASLIPTIEKNLEFISAELAKLGYYFSSGEE